MGREQGGRPAQEALIFERERFVGMQAKAIQKRVSTLELSSIRVSSTPEFRDEATFAEKPVMAISGVNVDAIALFVALSNRPPESLSFIPLLVTPREEGSGLLVDDVSGRVKTDAFWVCEDGELKHIVPSEPVTIDELNAMYDSPREDPVIAALRKTNARIHNVANNKLTAKQIFQNKNLAVPDGITIEANRDIQEITAVVHEFIRSLPQDTDIVLKQLDKAHGLGISMYAQDEIDDWIALAADFSQIGEQLLIEKRIIPKKLTPQQKQQLGFREGQNVDWNVRMLVDADAETPVAIDGEIRAAESSYMGVNISRKNNPATPARLDILDAELVTNLKATAEQVTKVFCQAVLETGEEVIGLAGVDLMVDQDGEILVTLEIEVGNVGGVATLTKLDGVPLKSVSTLLYEKWEEKMARQFRQKQKGEHSSFRRVEQNDEDKLVLYDAEMIAGNYANAEQLLLSLSPNFYNQEFILKNLAALGRRLGDMTKLGQYLERRVFGNQPPSDTIIPLD